MHYNKSITWICLPIFHTCAFWWHFTKKCISFTQINSFFAYHSLLKLILSHKILFKSSNTHKAKVMRLQWGGSSASKKKKKKIRNMRLSEVQKMRKKQRKEKTKRNKTMRLFYCYVSLGKRKHWVSESRALTCSFDLYIHSMMYVCVCVRVVCCVWATSYNNKYNAKWSMLSNFSSRTACDYTAW